MGKQFRKFKIKMWIGAILRALFFGAFVGMISLSAQWVYAKRTLTAVNSTRQLLLTLIPALVGALIVLVIFIPRNKFLAARLDSRMGLNEKIRTMIALRGDNSAMAVLQREDAERTLSTARRCRLRSVASWIFFALPVAGALAIYGALIMPIKASPEPPPSTPPVVWKMDIYTEQKLRDLIAYVEKSDMEEEPRYEVVGELEGLIIRLKSVRQETVMQQTVLQTATNIHTIVSEYNTYDVVADSLLKSTSLPVQQLGNSIRTLKQLLINETLQDIGKLLSTPEEGEAAPAAATDKAAVATQIAEELEQAVDRSAVSMSNPLNAALLHFATALYGITDETTDKQIAGLITETEGALEKALATPLENEIVEDTTIRRLLAIFGMEVPEELVKDNAYDPLEEEEFKPDEDDKDLSGIGGFGSGEVHFGSNDTIYDGDSEAYVPYKDVWKNYSSAIEAMLHPEEGEDSPIPGDLEDMLNEYIERLWGATQDPAD